MIMAAKLISRPRFHPLDWRIVVLMHLARAPNIASAPSQSSAILRLVPTVARCNTPEELLREVVPLLQRVMEIEVASLYLPAPNPDSFQALVWDRGALLADQPEMPRAGSPFDWVWQAQEPLLIHDLDSEKRFASLGWVTGRRMASMCIIPLSNSGRKIGALELANSKRGTYGWTFGPADLDLLQWLGGILALSIENTFARSELSKERKRTEALLAIQKVVAVEADLPRVLPNISRALQGLLPHCAAAVTVIQSGNSLAITHLFYPAADKLEHGRRLPVEQSLAPLVLAERQVKILTYQDLCGLTAYATVKLALDRGARSACLVPLVGSAGHSAVLAMSSRNDNAFKLSDVEFLKDLSGSLTAALESAWLNASRRRQDQRFEVLAQINRALLANESATACFARISGLIQGVLPHEYATFALHDKDNEALVRRVLNFPRGSGSRKDPDPIAFLSQTVGGHVLQACRAIILEEAGLKAHHEEILTEALRHGIRSVCAAPLVRQGRAYGVVVLGSSQSSGFRPDDLPFLEEVAARIALGVQHSSVAGEIRQIRGAGAKRQDLPLLVPIFKEVVGTSQQLAAALRNVAIVAASDATVLVLGETGTGKDLIAKAIHSSSGRREQPMVKLNCAAIPTGLLESELFGHEKGSFTGATSQKIGRVELAHRGTLFLDEIGEISTELQPKLLRVLQDGEFERLGGNRTIKVDFRLIAATNRELQKAVTDGQFRADLYYRLNVFPIRMPALRDRPTDIPDLVWHFVRKYEKRLMRHIETVSPEAMRAMVAWSWPGNVRELENFIERSVILTDSTELKAPLEELRGSASSSPVSGSLEQTEREHILQVLRQTGGALSGPNGAAAKLGLKRTTLQSKMQRLGITRSSYSRLG